VTTQKPSNTATPQSVPDLPADLDTALRRLKLAAIRRTAPEVLLTAKTQRWTPEEVVRTSVETEIAARDASNIRNRLKAASFPVPKTLESFDVAASYRKCSTTSVSRNGSGHSIIWRLSARRRQVIAHPDRTGDCRGACRL
jgi:hypothetical protein